MIFPRITIPAKELVVGDFVFGEGVVSSLALSPTHVLALVGERSCVYAREQPLKVHLEDDGREEA